MRSLLPLPTPQPAPAGRGSGGYPLRSAAGCGHSSAAQTHLVALPVEGPWRVVRLVLLHLPGAGGCHLAPWSDVLLRAVERRSSASPHRKGRLWRLWWLWFTRSVAHVRHLRSQTPGRLRHPTPLSWLCTGLKKSTKPVAPHRTLLWAHQQEARLCRIQRQGRHGQAPYRTLL